MEQQSLTQEELDELKNSSGFVKSNRVNYPTVKFNGNSGEMSMTKMGKDAQGNRTFDTTKIDLPLGIVILKERKSLTSFEKVGPKQNKERHYSSDFESYDEEITLWRQTNDEPAEKLDTCSAKEMREKYQKLRVKKSVYSILGDEVVKFNVKGGNLRIYNDYLKTVESPNMVYTVITSEDAVTDTGMKYKKLVFAEGETPKDMKFVLESLRKVKASIDESRSKSSTHAQEREVAAAVDEAIQPSPTEEPEF